MILHAVLDLDRSVGYLFHIDFDLCFDGVALSPRLTELDIQWRENESGENPEIHVTKMARGDGKKAPFYGMSWGKWMGMI